MALAVAMALAVSGMLRTVPAGATPHPVQSQNVAMVGGPICENGGVFPTTTSGPTGSFGDFSFTNVAVNTVSAALLAGYDTVLLNVCGTANPAGGTDFNCNIDTLSDAQQQDIVDWLRGGERKLIIYDSECSPQDYSWLPTPFTTSNPGALGGTGTVNIVEDNLLGTDDTGDAHFISATQLGEETDAVGDMNVLTARDPDMCLHMSGTNAVNQSGPTHVYALIGQGLLIYNGFDVDFLDESTSPDASFPAGNLAKLWLQELQQPRNGQGLACDVDPRGITVSQGQSTNPVGTQHTVTATIRDQGGVPQQGVPVTFTVTGPNANPADGACSPGNCMTDADGEVTYTYTGNAPGTDTIEGCFENDQGQTVCDAVEKTWTETQPGEGPPGDPTCSDGIDNDDDGLIDAADPGCRQPPAPSCQNPTITGSGVVNGTPGDDVIVTGRAADTINAMGGDDVICSSTGDDTVRGGPGNDTVFADGGDDLVNGDAGDDRLYGQAGNDTVNGGKDDDLVKGGKGDDALNGQDGADSLLGDQGVDTLRGDDGNDRLKGGADDDAMRGNGGDDSIAGDGGNDTMRGDGGLDFMQGGTGDDVMYGGTEDDNIRGDAGNDRLYGLGADDRLFGGTGNDRLDQEDGVVDHRTDGGGDTDVCRTDPGDVPFTSNCETVI